MLKETPLLNKCLSHFNSRCRAPEDNKRFFNHIQNVYNYII